MKIKAALILSVSLLAASCSTTKLVPEGEYRLASNKVEINGGGRDLTAAGMNQYIKQSSNSYLLLGWNPFLNVYNWSNGSGKGLNGVLEKIGTPPVIFNENLVSSSTENMENHLKYLGYYDSKVSAEIKKSGRLASVTYKVTPGKRYKLDEIVYDIPEGEIKSDFLADTLNMSVSKGSFLSENSLEQESARSTSYLRNLGYYGITKLNYFFEADTLSPATKLYYRIKGYTRNEGEENDVLPVKYHIGNVSISHPSTVPFRDELLRKFNTIKPGALYSENMVNTTYNRFAALKLFNSVSIEMTPRDSALVDCSINLRGADMMGFKANLEASVNTAGLYGVSPQLSFFHKNLFHGGEWLTVAFTGKWQFKPDSEASATEFGVSSTLSFPKLLGFPIAKIHGSNIPRTEVKASFNYQDRPEYERAVATFSYGYSGQIGEDIYYQIYPFEFNLAKLPSLSDSFAETLASNPYLWDTFEDHIDMGIDGMLYHTTDADIVPKTSYHYERLSFKLSGNVMSLFNPLMPVSEYLDQHLFLGLPYNQYVKSELSLGRTVRFGHEDAQALAMHLDAGVGYAYGNSYSLPFEEQFYCGGANSMRGWQARTLGPGFATLDDIFIIPSQTGTLKFEADLEYRFKAFWKLEGALFAEAGNVYDWYMTPEEALKSLAGDWGAGLRVNLDFILMRLDIGFKVHDPSRAEGQRWLTPDQWFNSDGFSFHFGVGYPF